MSRPRSRFLLLRPRPNHTRARAKPLIASSRSPRILRYQLAGSYAEPIAGDENPETYGVPIASLHTDHVAADNTRLVNYVYAAEQLLPPSRVPGFLFHQVGVCVVCAVPCVAATATVTVLVLAGGAEGGERPSSSSSSSSLRDG